MITIATTTSGGSISTASRHADPVVVSFSGVLKPLRVLFTAQWPIQMPFSVCTITFDNRWRRQCQSLDTLPAFFHQLTEHSDTRDFSVLFFTTQSPLRASPVAVVPKPDRVETPLVELDQTATTRTSVQLAPLATLSLLHMERLRGAMTPRRLFLAMVFCIL
jgi:hypothetical protein